MSDETPVVQVPDESRIFIVVQISGKPKSVQRVRDGMLEEIETTKDFLCGLMGRNFPSVTVHETQVS